VREATCGRAGPRASGGADREAVLASSHETISKRDRLRIFDQLERTDRGDAPVSVSFFTEICTFFLSTVFPYQTPEKAYR
jgi:hypothetical protein